MSDKTQQPQQTLVPDSKGVIRIKGYEDKVKDFQTDYRYFKKLESRVKESKEEFREATVQALGVAAPGVKRVEFMSEDGQVVPVGVPDYDKACNRNQLNGEKLSEIVQRTGLDPSSLKVFEKDEQFVLTGEFVGWLRQIIHDNYTAKGKPIPAGIEYTEETRLSVEGIVKLEKMAREGISEPEKTMAQMLLKVGKKAPAVSG